MLHCPVLATVLCCLFSVLTIFCGISQIQYLNGSTTDLSIPLGYIGAAELIVLGLVLYSRGIYAIHQQCPARRLVPPSSPPAAATVV